MLPKCQIEINQPIAGIAITFEKDLSKAIKEQDDLGNNAEHEFVIVDKEDDFKKVDSGAM
eukprot:14518459-Ditylum_brightwellii.AAC.1